MLTLSLIVASLTPSPPALISSDVLIEPGRIVFVQVDPDGTESRDAIPIPWSLVDPPEEPTPFDVCYSAAVVVCGVHNVKRVKFTAGPSGESCEFECGDNWPTTVK